MTIHNYSVAAVLWNPDEPTSGGSMTFYLVDGGGLPKPSSLTRREGISVPKFFGMHGVPIQDFMEMFPGCLVPDREAGNWLVRRWRQCVDYCRLVFKRPPGPITWNSPFRWERMPGDEESMSRIAARIGSLIGVYTFYRSLDTVPQFSFRVKS